MCTYWNRRMTSFAIRLLSLSTRSFAHLSCDATQWRVAQAIPHSLFFHFNYVFFSSLSRYFPTSKIILDLICPSIFSLSLSFSLLSFCFVRMVSACCYFLLLRPYFIHVALTELMFVQVVLVERTLVLGIVSDGQLLTFNGCLVLEPTLRR